MPGCVYNVDCVVCWFVIPEPSSVPTSYRQLYFIYFEFDLHYALGNIALAQTASDKKSDIFTQG